MTFTFKWKLAEGLGRQGSAAEGGRPIGSVFFVSAHFYIMNIYGYSLYIPWNIPSIHILDIFHVFSFVCFLIYGVSGRQILIAKPRLYFFQTLRLLFSYLTIL